jgi:hypothetical protein
VSGPVRIQRKRTKGWKMPADTVYVGRPSQWGNEFTVEQYGSHEKAVDMERHDLSKFECFHPEQFERWIAPLRGKNLACWCPLDQPCHADVLLKLANPKDTGA